VADATHNENAPIRLSDHLRDNRDNGTYADQLINELNEEPWSQCLDRTRMHWETSLIANNLNSNRLLLFKSIKHESQVVLRGDICSDRVSPGSVPAFDMDTSSQWRPVGKVACDRPTLYFLRKFS